VTGAVAVAVTGWGVHVPGVDLLARLPVPAGTLPAQPAVPAARAHELVGRKGLLGKDEATRLALCAVHRALGRSAGAPRPTGPADPGTAVVVSSNLGNVSSVVEVSRAVRTGGRRDVSPLAVPNASSNVVASTVAIWYRFGGPNLTVCSGATAGLDAVGLGALLLRSGRATRVVVVGTEPGDEVAVALHGGALRAGAACVILEPAQDAPDAPRLRTVHNGYKGDNGGSRPAELEATADCGDLYGAHGVVLAALAAALLATGVTAGPVRVACGDDTDGWRGVELHPIRAQVRTSRT
jgi:3-oxoacyl-[acyl-carrier-protein] synthase II